jgi:hypothetical protein
MDEIHIFRVIWESTWEGGAAGLCSYQILNLDVF